jgi:hypothetical protein
MFELVHFIQKELSSDSNNKGSSGKWSDEICNLFHTYFTQRCRESEE